MKAIACCTLILFFSGVAALAEKPSLPAAGGTSSPATVVYEADRSVARTGFQCFAPYAPVIDIRSDVAIVYGVDDTLSSRIAEWKRQGYVAQMMTGSAWGQYEDYIEGRFDGRPHSDEGQVDREGAVIWHHGSVPYMVPTPSFVAWLTFLAKQAIDAGAEALHFEEPEFWARAGYSEGFKKLWQTEYGEPWQRPDSSPDAFWRSSKLKYLLYKRTLEQLFRDSKEYARSKGRSVKCFVPTHSLVNYAQWGIVSPESSLMDLANCDGYIAQVWTGTARTPNIYRGVRRERTFETAFLEYSSMYSMVAPTGRTVYFLADPVEDDPNHTWDDYRVNYRRVVAASLLFPGVHHFEVMPWPDRVMTGNYPAGSFGDEKTTQTTIPPSYASELMTVVNTLHEMQPGLRSRWECGSPEIGVLASDTMMFQRGTPWEQDSDFSNFFGLAMPLVKAGIPANVVVLERVLEPRALEGVRVLLMSYEHMKPLKPEYHEALAAWVRAGGSLLYFGDDGDRFHGVREWWNAGATPAASPRADLFRRLGIASDATTGSYSAGKGRLVFTPATPRALAAAADGADTVLRTVRNAMEKNRLSLKTSNRLLLHRGPYVVGALLDESESEEPLRLSGHYCDLFTSGLALRKDPEFQPGEVFLLRRLDPSTTLPSYIAGNLRLERVETNGAEGTVRLHFRGPTAVQQGLCRLSLSHPPTRIEVEGEDEGTASFDWSPETGSALLRFANRPGGTTLVLHGIEGISPEWTFRP